MARDFFINGPCLVKVKGGAHMGNQPIGVLSELGLSSEAISVNLLTHHRDVLVDDYGPRVPAEVSWELAEARIHMTLVHYDSNVLDLCVNESMAGGVGFLTAAGTMAPAGTLMGNYRIPLSSGCHFISLNLTSPVAAQPYRFPTCYLAEQPLILPLGTKATQAVLNWRAIPYDVPTFVNDDAELEPSFSGEIVSSGVVLFTDTLDS